MRKNLDWQSDSACLSELTPDHWFSDDPEERRMALAVCEGCPVLAMCREWALTDFPETPDYYVVGGMTKRMINKERQAQGIQTPPRLRLPTDMQRSAMSRVKKEAS
jgi:hypothetical protein